MKAYRRGKRGQALVEFALVFPIFLLAMFGLFDIGRAVFAYNEITNAAREGTRMAIVNQDVPTIEARMAAQMPGTALSGSCVYFVEPSTPFPNCDEGTTTPTDPCPIVPDVGCIVHIEAWTDYAPITPIISNFLGPMTLTANSEASIEFVCPNPDIPEWDDPDECPKQNQ